MCLGFKAKGFEEILKDSATQHFQTASGLNIAMADDDSWEDVAGWDVIRRIWLRMRRS